MALNELIAQGAQFKAPDLLGQYATMQTLQQGMQQNQMNQLNMTEKSRSLAEQEGLRNYLRSNPNLDTLKDSRDSTSTVVRVNCCSGHGSSKSRRWLRLRSLLPMRERPSTKPRG